MSEAVTILDDEITHNEMLNAIGVMNTNRHEAGEVAWQIRVNRFDEMVGEMEPGQAQNMLEEIDWQLPSRARSVEIDRALDVLDKERIRIEDLAE